MYPEKQGRDGFLDLHALELDFLGQPRQRVLYAIMREHEASVDIGAYFEDHRNGEEAVTRRLAADVVHILDAVDGLFERRRHGAAIVSAEAPG
jgi:hypothetical protein